METAEDWSAWCEDTVEDSWDFMETLEYIPEASMSAFANYTGPWAYWAQELGGES